MVRSPVGQLFRVYATRAKRSHADRTAIFEELEPLVAVWAASGGGRNAPIDYTKAVVMLLALCPELFLPGYSTAGADDNATIPFRHIALMAGIRCNRQPVDGISIRPRTDKQIFSSLFYGPQSPGLWRRAGLDINELKTEQDTGTIFLTRAQAASLWSQFQQPPTANKSARIISAVCVDLAVEARFNTTVELYKDRIQTMIDAALVTAETADEQTRRNLEAYAACLQHALSVADEVAASVRGC